MQGNYFSINQIDENTYQRVNEYVVNRIKYYIGEGKHCFVKVEEYRVEEYRLASKEARGLYFGVWVPQIVKELNAKNQSVKVYDDKGEITEAIQFNKKYVHLLLKDRILGEKKVLMGKKEVTVPPSIAGYTRNKMCDYMRKVEEYAYERLGIILQTDQENEYEEWRRKQNA